MDLGTRNILGYDYLPYMTVVSLEMSDEPDFMLFVLKLLIFRNIRHMICPF